MDRHIRTIRIFDRNLNFLGEVDNFTSLLFTRRWNTYGEFEFHIEDFDKELIKKGNIIMVDNDESKCGIIEYIEINEEEGRDIKVKGFSLLYLLTFRLVVPPSGKEEQVYNAHADEIMIDLVKSNALLNNERKIANLGVQQSKKLGNVFDYSVAYTNLGDEITKLCDASGLGAAIDFDITSQSLVFKVLQGRDLSSNQDKNPPAIFSVDYDNVKKQTYIQSNISYKNCAYIYQESNKTFIFNKEKSGVDRREVFFKNEKDNTNLSGFAEFKLKNNGVIESYECEVNPEGYKSEWDLGDIVTTVSKKYGFVIHNRVNEVKEIYEKNTVTVEPIFGSIIPTILDEVKNTSSSNSGSKSFLALSKN